MSGDKSSDMKTTAPSQNATLTPLMCAEVGARYQ